MSENINSKNEGNSTEIIKDYISIFSKGLFSKNPVFILLMGLCPALAVSTSLTNGVIMGISVCMILILSNTIISIFRNFIPMKIKIFVHIVIIASLVTALDILLKIFLPAVSKSLDIYVPLLSINCLILGRAESYASRNTFGKSILDGFGMGLGFLISITVISAIRELLGNMDFNFTDIGLNGFIFGNNGSIFMEMSEKKIEILSGIKFFLLPAGGFIILGLIVALIAGIKMKLKLKKENS
jgi:Na+-translocating ferredoxin:NAD+ oxidoreductase subunit E